MITLKKYYLSKVKIDNNWLAIHKGLLGVVHGKTILECLDL